MRYPCHGSCVELSLAMSWQELLRNVSLPKASQVPTPLLGFEYHTSETLLGIVPLQRGCPPFLGGDKPNLHN